MPFFINFCYIFLIILQTPPPPPSGGDTGIDQAPIDNWLIVAFMIGIAMIFYFFGKSKKA